MRARAPDDKQPLPHRPPGHGREGRPRPVARHSWTSFAAELDIPVEVISSALGHSQGSAVTLVYIAIDLRKVDRAHRQVIDYALGDK